MCGERAKQRNAIVATCVSSNKMHLTWFASNLLYPTVEQQKKTWRSQFMWNFKRFESHLQFFLSSSLRTLSFFIAWNIFIRFVWNERRVTNALNRSVGAHPLCTDGRQLFKTVCFWIESAIDAKGVFLIHITWLRHEHHIKSHIIKCIVESKKF